jgi:hypothetical protein
VRELTRVHGRYDWVSIFNNFYKRRSRRVFLSATTGHTTPKESSRGEALRITSARNFFGGVTFLRLRANLLRLGANQVEVLHAHKTARNFFGGAAFLPLRANFLRLGITKPRETSLVEWLFCFSHHENFFVFGARAMARGKREEAGQKRL